MFIISWILIRVLTALALALALAVAALVAATASARGIGLAIAVWFVLPPGMLVGWLGVIAAYTAASDYGLMMMQRRSAERRAQETQDSHLLAEIHNLSPLNASAPGEFQRSAVLMGSFQ